MIELRNQGRVKLLATDIDGVMTDGGMYFGPNGQAIKRFDVKDGYGLKMLQSSGVRVAWITADESAITRARFAALGLDMLRDGVADKADALEAVAREMGCEAEEIVYVGDDLNDLVVAELVGTFVAPADATAAVKEKAAAVTEQGGGHGAVREVCEAIIEHNKGHE
jgi:3-deoxy-D-manno-octulosonate 8-phosphate phosphatase (KDO 8-P phosphatase)